MESETITPIYSVKLAEMLTVATDTYGNRPVFVNINGHNYIINDMEFSVNGNRYTLILS